MHLISEEQLLAFIRNHFLTGQEIYLPYLRDGRPTTGPRVMPLSHTMGTTLLHAYSFTGLFEIYLYYFRQLKAAIYMNQAKSTLYFQSLELRRLLASAFSGSSGASEGAAIWPMITLWYLS